MCEAKQSRLVFRRAVFAVWSDCCGVGVGYGGGVLSRTEPTGVPGLGAGSKGSLIQRAFTEETQPHLHDPGNPAPHTLRMVSLWLRIGTPKQLSAAWDPLHPGQQITRTEVHVPSSPHMHMLWAHEVKTKNLDFGVRLPWCRCHGWVSRTLCWRRHLKTGTGASNVPGLRSKIPGEKTHSEICLPGQGRMPSAALALYQ